MERLNLMLQAGAIDWDTYSRAVRQAQDELDRFSEQGVDAFRNVGDEFGHLVARIVDGSTTMRGALSNLLSGIGGRMISGAVSSVFSELPGFATKGSFRVGGVGGPDSQLVAFRASPGEQVDVRRPGQEQRVHVTVGVAADGNGTLMPFVANVVQAGLSAYDRQLPRRVQGINLDPRRR